MTDKILKIVRHFIIIVRKYEISVHKANAINNWNVELIMINDENNSLLDNLSGEVSESKIAALKKRVYDDGFYVFAIKLETAICVGYCCLSMKDTYDSVQCKMVSVDEDAYYFFDDYVKKEYRGMKVHYGSIIERIRIAEDKRKEQCFVYIADMNKASIHNYEACGFRLTEKVIAIRFIKKVIKVKCK